MTTLLPSSVSNNGHDLKDTQPVNPQKKNGFVGIANEIVKQLCKLNLNGNESRILWAIFRKTYGWQKKTDKISYSQFSAMTGISSGNVSRALRSLIKRNIIKADTSGYVVEYQFQKNYKLWGNKLLSNPIVSEQIVSNPITNTIESDSESIIESDSNKNNIKQYTKTSKTTSSSQNNIAFNEYKDSLRERFKDIAFDIELEKFNLYNENRKVKNLKLALLNWMQKASERPKANSSNYHNGNGHKTLNELPKPRYKYVN